MLGTHILGILCSLLSLLLLFAPDSDSYVSGVDYYEVMCRSPVFKLQVERWLFCFFSEFEQLELLLRRIAGYLTTWALSLAFDLLAGFLMFWRTFQLNREYKRVGISSKLINLLMRDGKFLPLRNGQYIIDNYQG